MTLNRPEERIERYAPFDGSITEQMPLLVANGRKPISYLDLMKRRLDIANTEGKGHPLYEEWVLNYKTTGDAIRRLPTGGMRFAWDSATARKVNAESVLSPNGLLVLSRAQYQEGDGPRFLPRDVKRYCGKWYTTLDGPNGIMANPLYVEGLARYDKAVARAHAQLMFSHGQAAPFNYEKLMAVFAPEVEEEIVEGLVQVGGLYVFGGSVVAGRRLDDVDGFLVGEAPKALARFYGPRDGDLRDGTLEHRVE